MPLRIPAENQDVQVYEDAVDPFQNGVHQPLKSLSCILEAEGYSEKFKQAKRCDDSRLADVAFGYRNLVVASLQVHLGEDGAARKARGEVLDVGYRVSVRRSDVV